LLILLVFFQSVLAQNITKSDALLEINHSEEDILEMQKNGFSIIYVNDVLIQAKNTFKQVEYAEILRSDSQTYSEKKEAQEALKLINWENLNYNDILIYTEDISSMKERSYLIYDSIKAVELTIISNEENGINVLKARELWEKASTSFYEDRYDEAEGVLQEVKEEIEFQKTQKAALNSMQRNAKNFIQQYWIYIIVILIAIGLGVFFSYKKISTKLLKNRIKKMKIEKEVINSLIKKSQHERFKQNKISGLVYNIRIKKYEEKLEEIKQELPVLESKLKKARKKTK